MYGPKSWGTIGINQTTFDSKGHSLPNQAIFDRTSADRELIENYVHNDSLPKLQVRHLLYLAGVSGFWPELIGYGMKTPPPGDVLSQPSVGVSQCVETLDSY